LHNSEQPEGGDPRFESTLLDRRIPNRAAGRMLRLLAWFAVLGSVVTGVAIIMPTLTTASDGLPIDLLLLAACGSAIAAGLFCVVRGLRRGRRWARVAGVSCGVVALAGFPVGTVAGCHVLWRLIFHWEPADQGHEPSR
jgi:O-antigen/teichoic acid export membrane protein